MDEGDEAGEGDKLDKVEKEDKVEFLILEDLSRIAFSFILTNL